MQVHVYIYRSLLSKKPNPKHNLKIAWRNQEKCTTPKVSILAGNTSCRKGLKEKLLTEAEHQMELSPFVQQWGTAF